MLAWNSINTIVGWELSAADVTIVHTPFFHTGGINVLTLPLIHCGGTLVLAAMYGAKIELVPDRIVEKELNVRGSFAYRDEFPMVIDALANGDIDPELFISHSFPLAQTPEAFLVQLDKDASLKVMVSG